MEAAAETAGEVIEVEDEQEEDYDPAWNEIDETNEEQQIENADESAEVVEETAADEADEGEDEEDADEEEHEDEKFEREEDEAAVNEVFETSKVKLSDGTEAPMISRGPRYHNGIWPFNCHLCGLHGFRNLNVIKKHLDSSKHKSLLSTMPLNAKNYNEGMHQVYTVRRPKYNNLIKILPGERIAEITPEYHDRILRVQERYFVPRPPEFMYIKFTRTEPLHLYNKKSPILGLSYCFKTHFSNTFTYYCSLCDVQCGQSAYQHFIGSKHRSRYAEKHFPRLLKRIPGFISDVEDEKSKQKIIYELIRKIYRTIEDKRGLREVHMVVRVRIFPRRCVKFCNKILHYGDNHVLVTDEELKEMIETCKKGETLLEPDPLNPPSEFERSKARSSRGEAESSSKRPRSRREESPPRKAPRLADNEINWDRYRRMLGAALDDIDERYADYEKIPEKHPAYEDEWKKFWNRRVREIEQDGLNPDDYDFKTEWIPYWKELMNKFHTTSISKTKFRIKKSLRLPFDKRSPSPIRKQRSHRHRRSPSPDRPSRRRRTRSRSPAHRSARRRESPPAIAKPLEPPGVISVLRLLTALEDNLGSLGPKALEYLSKSLLYEKENDQNANQLLLNQEYYVFFVTAKEKLKGQLIANLVEKPKYKAVTHVVEEIETLIEMFDDFCKRTGRTVTAQPQERSQTSSKQQEARFNDDDQYGGRSQDDYNRNRQQGFDRNRDDVNQYDQRRGGEMDQYRNSGGFNSQYGRSQNQYESAGANQYDDDAPSANQYGQNRSMGSNSNQGSGPNQYSRGGQGGVWQSGTNMTFRNNANNHGGAGSNPSGGNYGNYGNNGNQDNQGNYRSDRDGNLSGTSYGDRGGRYNSNLGSRGGGLGSTYNSSMAIRGGNSSSLGRGGNFNSPQGDAGDNQGYRSGNNYNSGGNNFNSGYAGNNQGRNMGQPEALMSKPLGNYGGGYGRSSMNTRGYGGGN